jgi:hypothetical protein
VEAVQRIVDDDVDVLVDLNGHTLRSGLHLFEHRPARVQVSFMGYPLTTALPEIDYFIGDAVVTPHWMQQFFTESLVRRVASTNSARMVACCICCNAAPCAPCRRSCPTATSSTTTPCCSRTCCTCRARRSCIWTCTGGRR